MKWFQPIECDKTVKKALVCDDSNFEEYDFEEYDFKTGKEILNWPNDVFFKASQKKYDGIPDDALQNAYMIPVYSKKLMDELASAGIEGIQYPPVKVRIIKMRYKTYFVLQTSSTMQKHLTSTNQFIIDLVRIFQIQM